MRMNEADKIIAVARLKDSASTARRLADDLEKLAPAEAMYLCSIASRLEIKAQKLTGK